MNEPEWRCDFCGWTGKTPAPENKCPKCGETAYMPDYSVEHVWVSGGWTPLDWPGEEFALFPRRARP